LGLALVFALVPFFKTEGMLLQVILFSVVGFAVSDFFLRKKASVRPALKLSLLKDSKSLAMSKQLFQYGLISFLPGTFSMVALLYLRGALMRQFGVEANGYFQVAYAMSAYYLPFVMNGIWGHFYPEMCALRSREEINREINQFVRFTLFASTAIAAGLIIFRRYVILMLYSGDFMSAYELLAIQGVGDIFFVLFCMFSTSLMARRKFKGVVFISAIGYNLFLVSSYFALTRMAGFGLTGLNLAIALTNIVFVAVYLAYYRWNTGFLPTRQNIRLFIKSALFLAVIYLIPDIDVLTVIAKVAISLLWLAVAMTREDAKGFAELIFFRGRAQND
jgi:PST family polysaccharide transporter